VIIQCANPQCSRKFEKPWKKIEFEKADRDKFCSRECYLQQFEKPLVGEFKICSKCLQEKDMSLFLKRYSKDREGRVSSWCKACFSNNQMVQWNATKLEVIEALGGKCVKCAHSFHPAVYELHHKDPATKSYDWSQLRKKPKAEIWAEVAKCDLICPSCHRLEHINQETWDSAQQVFEQRKQRESNPQGP
jgi:hypothetical protein